MFKIYGRKSSFKKDIDSGNILLNEIFKKKVKNFLEVGVYQGVTAKNVCDVLRKINNNNFMYYGIDPFEDTDEKFDKKEFTLKKNKFFSNPIKNFWFKYILKENPHSEISVKNFLNEYKNNVKLLKGYSNSELNKVPIHEIDFAFIDGGHSYETCKHDINFCIYGMKQNSIIVCDDYDQLHYGVNKAINEIASKVNSLKILNKRLAMITV